MKASELPRHLKRSEVQWTLVPILAAIGLSFVPGFNVLSFYFCLPMALLLAMAAGSVVITATTEARRRGGSTGAGMLRGMIHAVLLPLGPLTVISFAHFLNGPCDYLFGLGHYVAGPWASAVTGGATAAACSLALRRERNASAAFMVIFVLSFVPNALTLYLDPSVRFFNPFLGLYPGPIYDELIEVAPDYIAFRLWCLAAAAAVIQVVITVRDMIDRGLGPRGIRPIDAIAALLLLAASGILWNGSGRFDFTTGRKSIKAELSVTRTSSWCVIHADARFNDRQAELDRLMDDCGFRHRQMADFFGVDSSVPIEVFLYRDADQKGRLIGARWVEISKPWLNEVHVTDVKPGDMILAHEIAHVAAGRLAGNWLAMPLTAGLLPDMGRVEGLAVAAAFADEGPSPHEWAAGMLAADIDPDVESLFSPLSFITGGAAASYNTAGSFLRFIRDEKGSEAIRRIAAGDPFTEAVGADLETLVDEWLGYLEANYSTAGREALKARAAARFSDPGVLNRRCPLDVSRKLRDAIVALDGLDGAAAARYLHEASCIDPGDRELTILALRAAILAGTADESSVIDLVHDLLESRSGPPGTGELAAAADLLALKSLSAPNAPGSSAMRDRAATLQLKLLGRLSDGDSRRATCIRVLALQAPSEVGLAVFETLADPRPFGERDVSRLADLAKRMPDVAVIQYFCARAAMLNGSWDQALTCLDRFAANHPSDACTSELASASVRMTAIATFWTGDLARAAEALDGAISIAGFEGDRLRLEEYRERIADAARHPR